MKPQFIYSFLLVVTTTVAIAPSVCVAEAEISAPSAAPSLEVAGGLQGSNLVAP